MKLPNLPRGNVRQLVAPDQSRAKINAASAAVGAIGRIGETVARTIDKTEDNAARLNAEERALELDKQITQARRQMHEDYLNDPNKSESDYIADDVKMVEQLSNKAQEGANRRTLGYLSQRTRHLRDGTEDTVRYAFYDELLKQRNRESILRLGREMTQSVLNEPDRLNEFLDTSFLDDYEFSSSSEREATVTGWRTDAVNAAVLGHLETQNPQAAMDVLRSDAGQYLTPNQQASFRIEANKQATAQANEAMNQAMIDLQRNPDAYATYMDNAKASARYFSLGGDAETEQLAEAFERDYARNAITGYQLAGEYQAGLDAIASGQFDQLPAEELARRQAGLQSAVTQRAETSITQLGIDAQNAVAAITAGNERTPEMTAGIEAALDSGVYTPSQTARLEQYLVQIDTAEQYSGVMANYGSLSLSEKQAQQAEVADITNANRDDYNPAAAAYYGPIQQSLQAEIARHARELAEDPAGYVTKYDPITRDAYQRFTEAAASDTAQIDPYIVQSAGAEYITQLQRAQAEQGVLPVDQTYLPENSPLIRSVEFAFDQGSVTDQMGVLMNVSRMFPVEIVKDLTAEISEQRPEIASALAFTQSGLTGLAAYVVDGAIVRKQANATAGSTTVKDGDLRSRLEQMAPLPYEILGPNAVTMQEAQLNMYYGKATEFDVIDEDTLQWVIDNSTGAPIPTNASTGAHTLSYRRSDANNQLLTPGQFQAQLWLIANERVAIPEMQDIQGNRLSPREVFDVVTMTPTENGRYALTMQNSALIGETLVEGRILNANGTQYILDLDALPRATENTYTPPLPEDTPRIY